jgi:4-nitrophenyl phosphatase
MKSTIRAVILDMDGVLWRNDEPIVNLAEVFSRFSRLGILVALATNNATRNAGMYVTKLADFGVRVEPWQVVNSAEATAAYLAGRFPDGGPVYVVGEQGLLEALAEKGFQPAEQNVLAVIAGMDRGLTYDRLAKAALLIRSGVPFIGTNPDRTYPTPQGQAPGAGSILALLQAASDVEPLIIGKPAPAMYQLALSRLGTKTTETLVVGDRLETDIVGAQHIGCPACLVLSGVSSMEQAHAWRPAPEIIAADLADLVDRLEAGTNE